MDDLEQIKVILDDDETILFSMKPNKRRFITITSIFSGLISFIIGTIFLLVGVLSLLGIGIHFTNESGARDLMPSIIFIIFGSVPFFSAITLLFRSTIKYQKAFYIVTNKRLILRNGFIGVDYKSIAIKNIITVDVRVDFLDKLVTPNTGSIVFGSAANPVVNNNQNNSSDLNSFIFAHIDDPYGSYKKIKQIIDSETK